MKTVAILLYDNVEVLDACGPFEVFASVWDERDEPVFRVVTVAETGSPVTCSGGLIIQPNLTFSNYCEPDVLVIPGGPGRKLQMRNESLLAYVAKKAERAEIVLSVCSGAFLLSAAGLAGGLAITSHHETLAELATAAPDSTVETKRIVDTGRVVSCGGVSAGLDASLHIVTRLCGIDIAMTTAAYLEYESTAWRDGV